MESGDFVDVGLITGKPVGLGMIIAVVDDEPAVVAAVVPTVSIAVLQLPQRRLSIQGVPRGWLKVVGPHKWRIDLPDRGQFSPADQDEEIEGI